MQDVNLASTAAPPALPFPTLSLEHASPQNILDANEKPKLVPENEEVKIKETDMVGNEEVKKIENQGDEVVNQAGDIVPGTTMK